MYIPKEKDKVRPLGIPTVRCRIAQEVVRQLLNPIFEPLFHDDSYGFRTGRNGHMAIAQIIQYAHEGYKFVLNADIKGFFDSISHELIMDMIAAEIADGNILGLIKKFLRSGVMEDGVIKPTRQGTSQDGVISPLLANIVLNDLDWQLSANGFKFVRYADDFVIMAKSKTQAETALDLVKCIMKELDLELNQEKTEITSFSQGFEFLGFFISSKTIKMRPKAEERFKSKVRTLTKRCYNLDTTLIVKLNWVIRGTVNYFHPGSPPISTSLHGWIGGFVNGLDA